MPRDGSGIYSKPSGTTAVSGAAVASAPYNAFCDDLVADANAARPITAGGTGATSASAARTALGVSATDATITAIAALDFSTAGSMLYSTAADTFSLLTSTVAGRALLTAADAAAQRTALGLGTAALKNTGTSGNNVPLLDGANTWSGANIWSGATPDKRIYESDGPTNEKYWWEYIDAGIYSFRLLNDAANADTVIYSIDRTAHTAAVVNFNPSGGITLQYGGSAVLTAASTGTSGTKLPYLDGANTWSGAQIVAVSSNTPLTLDGTGSQYQVGRIAGVVKYYTGTDGTSWLILDGSASTKFAVNLSTGAAASGGVSIPTISSSDVLTNKQIRVPVSSETSGTLTSASSNKQVNASGDVTINDGVHEAGDRIEIYAGASARSIIQDTGMTLRLDGSATTGTRSLAARGRAALYFVSNSEAIVSGMGVS